MPPRLFRRWDSASLGVVTVGVDTSGAPRHLSSDDLSPAPSPGCCPLGDRIWGFGVSALERGTMATPTMIEVTGVIESAPGVPDPAARLTFERKVPITHTDGTLIEPRTQVAVVALDGSFSVLLEAGNDPLWQPVGWTYEAVLRYSETRPPIRWSMSVPYNASSADITIGEAPPTVPPSVGVSYALANHTHGDGGDHEHPSYVTEAELAAAIGGVSAPDLSGYATDGELTALDNAVSTALGGKANTSHTHTATQISDSTATGRGVVTAVDAAAARTAIGAGTSSLALGTSGSTALAGDSLTAHVAASDPHTQYARILSWNGSAYVLNTTGDIYVGPAANDPGVLPDGSVWIKTT